MESESSPVAPLPSHDVAHREDLTLGDIRKWLWLLVLCVGCAGAVPRVDDPNVELAPDEGILLVHVDTDFALDALYFGSTRAVEDLRPGEHLVPIAVPAGDYRWSAYGRYGAIFRLDDDDDERWKFRVEPGRLNYAGQFIARDGPHWAIWTRLTQARIGLLIRTLLRDHPRLFDRFGLVYGGSPPDDFLAHYLAEREALEAARR